MRLRASEIAAITTGTLRGPDVDVEGAGIDSRTLRPGSLFVPIVAVRDGHGFLVDAVGAGAVAYLTAHAADPSLAATAVEVADTAEALTRLGASARARHAGPVVGVTGSVGKTSAKDLIAAAVGTTRSVAASERSFNNELGVPLTILNAPDATEVLVVELGARGAGHIQELCEVAAPTIGVVTTVVAAHTEHFGDLDAIAEAKGELIAALPASGTAILAADVPVVAAMARRTDARVLRFGVGGDVWAEHVALDADLRPRFELHSPWGTVAVHLGVRGAHQVANALAAAAVALVADVPLAAVAEGLGTAELSPWRMELRRTARGAVVLNDAYNANPASMAAALDALAALEARRRVAVLGPMAELGERAAEEHRALVRRARDHGIEVLPVGTDDYGLPALPDVAAAAAALGELGEGDAVLVKGSRVAGLERLAELLAPTD